MLGLICKQIGFGGGTAMKLIWNTLCLASFLFATGLMSPTGLVYSATGPNVVLLITDDQGYGDIGFHGNKEIQTPTLDALARGSLRLTNFHVDPTCAETRAALMTGQYPLRNGVWHTIMGRSILNKNAVTMPQLFQKSGYRTGMFGKWHLGDNYPYRPQDRGFEESLHLGGGGISQLPDVWGNDYFDDVYWSKNRLQPVRGYCTDVFFDAAIEFIKASSDKPFFCYLATNAPHAPYNVPEQYKKPYLEKGIESPRAEFYGMISNIDDNVARLLAALDQKGISENTIFVFMTDNGSAAGYMPATEDRSAKGFNAGMRARKGSQYDGGHRVPCLIRYPKALPVDRDFDRLCAHMDLLPTLAGLCSVDTGQVAKLDGRNLVDYVVQGKPWNDRTLVVQSHRVEEPTPWTKSAVMTDRWRLVDGKDLYEIHLDPGQMRPLKGSEYEPTIERLRAFYESWWKEMAVDPERYASISLGDPVAQRVRLTGHDWHAPQPVVTQKQVLEDPVSEGFWAVDVLRAGAYQFLLSRRPLEEPGPVRCRQARLEVGGVSAQVNVHPGAVLIPITIRLQPGETKLYTQLLGDDGSRTSAYFVTVNYLGDLPQSQIDAQASRLPDWLHAGDRIAWLGGTLIERAGETGALEAELSLRAPLAGLTYANLGWSGDSFSGRARAVFGSTAEGRMRRLEDLRLSGASVVAIAYGMSELLNRDLDLDKVKDYESELRELILAIQAQGKRAVLLLPPKLSDDIEGTGAEPTYREVCASYQLRSPALVGMIRRVAADMEIPRIDLPEIHTSMFESGTYLSQTGYRKWANSAADAMFASAASPTVSSRTGEAELYRLGAESQRLFFDMHRPQNETYLLLFRKHEQGNNAVEIGQYRPLVAEAQLQLIHAANGLTTVATP